MQKSPLPLSAAVAPPVFPLFHQSISVHKSNPNLYSAVVFLPFFLFFWFCLLLLSAYILLTYILPVDKSYKSCFYPAALNCLLVSVKKGK